MNLKEKWTKQNNSVKMLLRKLKRHDTVVVAIAVVIAVVLCGGLIYLSTPVVAASAKDELVEVQERDNEQTIEKLDELSEYLNGLDKSITESKDSFTDFYEKDGENKLLNEKNTEKITNTVTDKVTNLGKELTTIHDNIGKTEADIEKLREMIEKGDADSKQNISENFTNVYNNLEEIEDQYNKSQERTKELIKEVTNNLASTDEKLSGELKTSYTELLNKLNESNNKLSDQNSENLKNFKEDIGNLNQEISEWINELSGNMDGRFDGISSDMNGKFGEMTSDMNGKFGEMSSDMNGKFGEMTSDMNGKFGEMTSDMNGKFGEMSSDMNGKFGEMTSDMNGKFGKMSSDMNGKFGEMSSEMSGLNTNIDNHFKSMNLSLTGDMADLKKYISGEMSSVNGKVDQVFQRVSNGKKLLASTLLTKNVRIREDATFAEIAKAIESIPVKVVLDKDDVPGKVVYDYHYHVDGHGNVCNMEYVPIANKGGCYNREYIHIHNDACYSENVIYSYRTKKDVKQISHVRDEWDGTPHFRWECEYCGADFVSDDAYHIESTSDPAVAKARAKGKPTERVQRILTCTTPEGSVIGYAPSCNFIHGQVVAARIDFSDGYEKYNTAMGLTGVQELRTSLMMVPASTGSESKTLWEGFDLDETDMEDESDYEYIPEDEEDEPEPENIDTAQDTNIVEAINEVEEVPDNTGDENEDVSIENGNESDNESSDSSGDSDDSNDDSHGEDAGGDVIVSENTEETVPPEEDIENEN